MSDQANVQPNAECRSACTVDSRPMKNVLVTGASGYLGRSLCSVLSEHYNISRFDIAEIPGPGTFRRGSVTDRAAMNEACAQIDGLVLAHMAPNRTAAYDWPDACMDINVKGVALALEAAVRNHIRRVIVISSIAVVWRHVQEQVFLTRELAPSPTDLYGMTKVLQENIAHFYHQSKGVEIAVLRPAYVIREDTLVNKYGEKNPTVTWQCVDPRDIGSAVHGALEAPDLRYEVFYLMAGPDAERHADIASTQARLGWRPMRRFQGVPVEPI